MIVLQNLAQRSLTEVVFLENRNKQFQNMKIIDKNVIEKRSLLSLKERTDLSKSFKKTIIMSIHIKCVNA